MSKEIQPVSIIVNENDTSVTYALKRIGYVYDQFDIADGFTSRWLKHGTNDSIFTRLLNEDSIREMDIVVLEKDHAVADLPVMIDQKGRIHTMSTKVTRLECFVYEGDGVVSRLTHSVIGENFSMQHPIIEMRSLDDVNNMQYESKYIIRYRYPKVVIHC